MTTDNGSQWGSINDVLEFAIDKEQEAVDFYGALAESVENQAMRAVFTECAAMEEGHKIKLEKVRIRGDLTPSSGEVLDLKIADYLVDVVPTPDMDYQQSLIIAMKREQAACNLYNDLAAAVENRDVRDIMLGLAQEEAKHKLRFETEYDDCVLLDN